MTLSGRLAVITGASSGIGAATASALTGTGCRVVLVGRDEARLARVAERVGGRAVAADLETSAGVERVAELASRADLLVNNAGVGWAGTFESMNAEDVARLVSTNLLAPVQLTRAVVPAMRQRGAGHVVFVSSIAVVGVRGEAVYSATKAALRTFAASLRYEEATYGVGVTTVLPGAVRTPFFATRGTVYGRRFPRQVPADLVARALVRAVQQGRAEVFVPRWLSLPARFQGALPGTFHRLAQRFD